MLFLFFLGFLLGALAVIAVEVWILLLALDRLRRKAEVSRPSESQSRDLDSEQSLTSALNKQGPVWILDSQKVPKLSANESPPKAPKEQKNKKGFVEVHPIKKYAKLKDRSLILSDLDGSQETIELLDCTIVAVSASNISPRKWAKRYPIRLESNNSIIYHGSKTCYLYLDTSWEKESWCKALRLASCCDEERLKWHTQLREEFHHYLASLSAEYPSFLKPTAPFGDSTDKPNRSDGTSSRVRLFLRKLAKKTSRTGIESKISSASSSANGERKTGDKLHSLLDASLTGGSIKGSSEDKSSSNSLQDVVKLALEDKPSSLLPIVSDPGDDDKLFNDEGTLCWNLLFSRLFFDAKRSVELNDAIKARIQRTLSNMRTPSYIGGVTCTGIDLGTLPPYIHKIRVLPSDLNEVWAVDVDIEYIGGIILDIETRLEVCEPDLQKDIINTSMEPSSDGEVTSDLLEGIEYYGNQLRFSSNSIDSMENRDEGDKVDGLRHSKSSGWKLSYISRWKSVLHSIAGQVSQVPLSLAIRVTSLRGTLRLHIKPPPSDRLWFGFTSMPEIDWNLDSSVGDRKISSSHVALLIGNRFKAAIREALVLPNCESIYIPWMLAEKDDWAPRKVAPFLWVKQDATDMTGLESTNSQPGEVKMKLDSSNGSKAGPIAPLDDAVGKKKNVMHLQQPPQESSSEPVDSSQGGSLRSLSASRSFHGSSTGEELRVPLLGIDETQENYRESKVESPMTSSSGTIEILEEPTAAPLEEDVKQKRMGSRKARMMDLGKKMGEKLEEKRRHIEERGRNIVEKMLENSRT